MPTQTTTHVDELKINRLSKALYDSIADPSSNELYIVTDEQVDYSDITNKPTIGSATLTIQKNGTTVTTFGANATSNVTANITVPTTAGDVGAVAANTAITGDTKCKITYDSKGLVTAGADLSASDIPDISATYQVKLVSGTNIKTVNNNNLLGSGNITIDSLPAQSGNSGKFLTTNGTAASWVAIEEYTANEVETLWNSL